MRPKQRVNELVDAIDSGATTAEEIHKSIAELPLKILEQSEVLRGPAKEMRRFQDRAIGAIYDVVRDVNQKVGSLASDLLAKAPDRPVRRARTAPKRHAAAHVAAH